MNEIAATLSSPAPRRSAACGSPCSGAVPAAKVEETTKTQNEHCFKILDYTSEDSNEEDSCLIQKQWRHCPEQSKKWLTKKYKKDERLSRCISPRPDRYLKELWPHGIHLPDD